MERSFFVLGSRKAAIHHLPISINGVTDNITIKIIPYGILFVIILSAALFDDMVRFIVSPVLLPHSFC